MTIVKDAISPTLNLLNDEANGGEVLGVQTYFHGRTVINGYYTSDGLLENARGSRGEYGLDCYIFGHLKLVPKERGSSEFGTGGINTALRFEFRTGYCVRSDRDSICTLHRAVMQEKCP